LESYKEGKPYLRLWQGDKKVDYPLSISHEEDYVVAVVMNMPISGPEAAAELNPSTL
jgi:phosphopantetheinyl transferase (holo-ACP synthase)